MKESMAASFKYVINFSFVLIFTFFTSAACSAADVNDVVYVTKSGAKYHRAACSALKNSKIKTSLNEAVLSGKTPCAVCSPPVLGEIAAAVLQTTSGIYRVNLEKLKSFEQADITKMISARVTRHVDGDTVELQIDNPPPPLRQKEKVRMIGVDTPETVHPNKDVEYFGKEASDWTKKALLGKDVYVALDWDTRDKYDRLLVYIYTKDGKCHNAELIKQGYGHAYTRFPFQFLEEFRAIEKDAKEKKRGLWSN
ncbi:hypothetical protein AGMMS50212_16220 [Spirochaetia bacterium]|nr:hypothetical protein AGMMS50212_16220 [Spirochaetia bacterium]